MRISKFDPDAHGVEVRMNGQRFTGDWLLASEEEGIIVTYVLEVEVLQDGAESIQIHEKDQQGNRRLIELRGEVEIEDNRWPDTLEYDITEDIRLQVHVGQDDEIRSFGDIMDRGDEMIAEAGITLPPINTYRLVDSANTGGGFGK